MVTGFLSGPYKCPRTDGVDSCSVNTVHFNRATVWIVNCVSSIGRGKRKANRPGGGAAGVVRA